MDARSSATVRLRWKSLKKTSCASRTSVSHPLRQWQPTHSPRLRRQRPSLPQHAQQKLAADRAENCTRAKQAKASLDSGQLMKHTNAKGEQVFMDDASRAAERKRAQSVIDADCKP